MGKTRKLVALLVVVCILATLLPSMPLEEYEASEKIGSELLDMMDITYDELTTGEFVDSGETYSCIIWIEDVELEEAMEAGIDAAEMTRDDYSVKTQYEYPYTTYESDGLTYVDVNLDENESDEYVQTYIEAEREAATELYTTNNNSFVAENFMARDMAVQYVSQYSPCIFAELSITKIAELIEDETVFSIGYAGDEESIEINLDENGVALASSADVHAAEVAEALEIMAVDDAKSTYNVTGAGVKIGQLESESNHANYVFSFMTAVAPDATYYKSWEHSSTFSFYEDMEWLISQGVNIINMSFGYKVYSEYDERTRWVEHITYNHDVHVVMASGNNGSTGVLSPGMAYNIITVGATTMDIPCVRRGTSAYNDEGVSGFTYLTYKPDLMAPGTFSAGSGTSCSAPLVAGVIGLLCEYEPTLKTKQHTVKAILAASTGKETGTYVTADEEFTMYGAGVVDARSAIWVISKGNYSYWTRSLSSSTPSRTYDMTVTSSDTCMRIALAYAYRVKYDTSDTDHSLENLPLSWGMIGEVELTVYSPSGQKVVEYDGVTGANLKVFEFDPRGYGTGTYTIEVTLVTPQEDGSATVFGIAWR